MRVIKDVNAKPAFTDGEDLYISPLASKLSETVLIFHERGHILLKHFARMGDRDPELWNLCSDIEIAQLLYPIWDYNNLINNITRREVIFGAITFPFKGKPNITIDNTAEQIYEMFNLNDELPSYTQCSNPSKNTKQEINSDEIDINNIRESAKKIIDAEVENSNICNQLISNITKLRQESLRNQTVVTLHKASQNALCRVSSYSRPNRRAIGNHISKGKINKLDTCECIVYVDVSGSFTPEKTKAAEERIEQLKSTQRGAIRYNLFYFATTVGRDREDVGAGTNYNIVFEHILRFKPNFAIIVTDDDSCCPIPKMVTTLLIEIIGCDYNDASIVKQLLKLNKNNEQN